jgi:hypothetical protein
LLAYDTEEGVQGQMYELLRSLVDPGVATELQMPFSILDRAILSCRCVVRQFGILSPVCLADTMETTPEKDEFLDVFYMNFMGGGYLRAKPPRTLSAARK